MAETNNWCLQTFQIWKADYNITIEISGISAKIILRDFENFVFKLIFI